MAIFWRRAVILLVIVIAVLQVIHMTLLSRLEAKRNEKRKLINEGKKYISEYSFYINSKYTEDEMEKDRKRMIEAIKDSSVLDSSGEYHIINYFQRANNLGIRNHIRQDISLITQSSINQIYHLEDIVKRWHGLVSVGLFVLNSDILLAIEIILQLRRCNPYIRYNTSFHLVYPLSVPHPAIGATTLPPQPSFESLNKYNCDNISNLLKSLQPGVMNYAHNGIPYPNNLLRNLARRNCLTEYVFVIDIDLVPNNNLYQQFMEFAKENKLFTDLQSESKTVFVVPTYEINTKYEESLSQKSNNNLIPEDKVALIRMMNIMQARPFYFELCWKCQKYTEYETWQKEPMSSKLAVIYEVFWNDPWEPFYISRNNAPFYDERFRQYGFNRISQVCELHIAGYKFSVLNNAFIIHKGFKTVDSFHKEKDLEQEKKPCIV